MKFPVTARVIPLRRNWPWLLIAVALAGAAWKIKFGAPGPPPDTVAYHYSAWLHERLRAENFASISTNSFSVSKALWYLDGKPSFADHGMIIEEHENALIRLGYFQERAFEWKGGDIFKFVSAFDARARQIGFTNFYSFGSNNRFQDTTIDVKARKEDMPTIEAIIKNIETMSTNRW